MNYSAIQPRLLFWFKIFQGFLTGKNKIIIFLIKCIYSIYVSYLLSLSYFDWRAKERDAL